MRNIIIGEGHNEPAVLLHGQKGIFPRKRVLVYPGIGDIHWVLLKLEDFALKNKFTPEVYIWDFDGRPRSLEFLELIPFIEVGGYWHSPANVRVATPVEPMQENVYGFDYYFCFNHALENGKDIVNDILPEYDCNFNYEIIKTDREKELTEEYNKKYGKFFLTFFSNHGMFQRWVKSFCAKQGYRICKDAMHVLGAKPILTGCHWDMDFSKRVKCHDTREELIDLVGQTDLIQFLALLRSEACAGFVGFCGGNTIISTHFGVKTAMLWSRHFPNPGFMTDWVNPDSINKWYLPMLVEEYDRAKVLNFLR